MSGRSGRAQAYLAAAAVVFAFLLGAPSAQAGAVTIGSSLPTPGSTITYASPNLSVRATSTATIPLPQSLTIDGLPLSAAGYYLETGGHWEDDGCDLIWVPDTWDYRDLTLTAYAPNLTDGVHSASAHVTDSEGGTATQGWSFNVAQAPSVSSVSPSANSTGTTPLVRVTFADNPGTHTCELTVGGVSVPTTQVGSVFQGQVTQPLADGALINASAKVTDQGGRSTTYNWSFRVFTIDQMTAVLSPASGSTIGQYPSISCTVSSTVPVTQMFWVMDNGTPVNGFVQAINATHYRSYLYPGALSDGSHTATATAFIAGGGSKGFSATYLVNQSPTFTSFAPGSGTRTTLTTPTIQVGFSDNLPANRVAEMRLDGSPVAFTLTGSTITHVPATPLTQEQTHTVWARLQDAAGNVTSATWSFWVDRYAAMPLSACSTCHSTYPASHQSRGCDLACHSASGHGDDNCNNCHGSPHDMNACASCHSTVVGGGHETASGWPHNSTTDFTTCRECHSSSLSREHARRTGAGGAPLSCATCHGAAASATVKSAIVAGDTRCATCHPGADHETVHASPTSVTCFGAGCHPATRNLVDVHRPYTGAGTERPQYVNVCALCHENPSVDTASAGTACTPACHSIVTHSQYSTAHAPTAASSDCTECHDAALATIHLAGPGDWSRCDVCHATPGNWSKTADCEGCHALDVHEALHSSTLGSGCAECHASNLLAEHIVKRGLGCASCHDAGVSGAGAAPEAVTGVTGEKTPKALDSGPAEPLGEKAAKPLGSEADAAGVSASFVASGSIEDAIAGGDTSCLACHTGMHGGIEGQGQLPGYPGYLDWSVAATMTGNAGTSPHGGYTASTNKCAVCHSVHNARPGGSVLTAFGPYGSYGQGCMFCRAVGSTFSAVQVTAYADGFISPHTTCDRCHAANPHAVGTSAYQILASRLLDPAADGFIGADLAAGANGLQIAMFDGTGNATDTVRGLTLGTGYLCGTCHQQTFAVNTAGVDPAGGGAFTGHRVLAQASDDWDQSAFGGSLAASAPVAYADAIGCVACHDAEDSTGDGAFPHGYVDAGGAVAPKTAAGASYIWLTVAADAVSAKTLVPTAGDGVSTTPGSVAVDLLTDDGLCLKCHRASSTTGVGLTY